MAGDPSDQGIDATLVWDGEPGAPDNTNVQWIVAVGVTHPRPIASGVLPNA